MKDDPIINRLQDKWADEAVKLCEIKPELRGMIRAILGCAMAEYYADKTAVML